MTVSTRAVLSCCAAIVVVPSDTEYGSTDSASLELFRREVLRAADETRAAWLILDLSQVSHFGAAFLGLLASVDQRLRHCGRRLVVCGDSQNLVSVVGLDALLPRFATLREAICSTMIG